MLSFPRPGMSYALDLAVGPQTQALVDALNELVHRRGRPHLPGQGRLHPPRALPRHGAAPRRLRARCGSAGIPNGRLKSAQSVRLFGDRSVKVALLGATKGMGRAVARADGRAGRRAVPARPRPRRARAQRRRPAACAAPPATVGIASCDLLEPTTFAPGARRRRARARRARRGRRHRRALRHPGALERGCRPARPPAHRRLHQHHPVLRAGARAAAGRAAARKRLCVFSSVAGDRARKPVMLYGAAKAGLSHYLTGLDHKFAGDGLKVMLVKPGFVKTGMTAGLPAPPFAGEPEPCRAPRRARHRPRHARRLRPRHLALDHAGDPPAAAGRDAADRVLSRRGVCRVGAVAVRRRALAPRTARDAERGSQDDLGGLGVCLGVLGGKRPVHRCRPSPPRTSPDRPEPQGCAKGDFPS